MGWTDAVYATALTSCLFLNWKDVAPLVKTIWNLQQLCILTQSSFLLFTKSHFFTCFYCTVERVHSFPSISGYSLINESWNCLRNMNEKSPHQLHFKTYLFILERPTMIGHACNTVQATGILSWMLSSIHCLKWSSVWSFFIFSVNLGFMLDLRT